MSHVEDFDMPQLQVMLTWYPLLSSFIVLYMQVYALKFMHDPRPIELKQIGVALRCERQRALA